MTNAKRNRLLLAVDGSAQALNVVHYVSELAPCDRTDIVLFNAAPGIVEVLRDMTNGPPSALEKDSSLQGLTDSPMVVGDFNRKALAMLANAGFAQDAIGVKTQARQSSLLKEIIQESYQGYSAIVVGRTGISRLKYLIFGSIAQKLAERVRHIPILIIGGKPKPANIMIALDDSIEAKRGIDSVAALAGSNHPRIILCHCLDRSGIPGVDETLQPSSRREKEWIAYHQGKFRTQMDEAARKLEAAGVDASSIARKFVLVSGNVIEKLIEIAQSGDVGTIVVGQRDVVNFAHEHIRGRYSEGIIGSLDNLAIWVVS